MQPDKPENTVEKPGEHMEGMTDRDILIATSKKVDTIEETLVGKMGANGKKGLMERVRTLESAKTWILGVSSSVFLMLAIMFLKDLFGG